ncbi:MAG: c-type cytochrome [Bacteroidia bacterium]|nr:c-type cytochrome [Bacteroidia bacterium]
MQLIGKNIFFDPSLSNPFGQSCASCHNPSVAFTDSTHVAFSLGAIKELHGTRNTPSISYSTFSPYLFFDSINETYVGGLFWDGRANTLAKQAEGPLLNHLEMNNQNKSLIVQKVKSSNYSKLFMSVFGPSIFNNTENAFNAILESIEEYEESREANPFSSKYDCYLAGKASLTEQEARGLKLFNDPQKGNCAACHPSAPDKITGVVLFTDFTYDNIGVPGNENNPDLGLGKIVNDKKANGMFRVPSLRNVAKTAPYFHNGSIKTLEDAVSFYNERDNGKFGKPECVENINTEELGNLKLNAQEIKDIVAFLYTLTDLRFPEKAISSFSSK